MPNYRRNRLPGGTYFFTVNLLERNSRLLIDRIEALREAVRKVRRARPFHIDYVHFNPVKHGHVTRVADWPYSSFHRLVAAGVYPPDWADNGKEGIAAGERG